MRRRRNIRSAFKLFNTVFSSALSPVLTTYFCISIVMTSTSSTGKELRLFRWERAEGLSVRAVQRGCVAALAVVAAWLWLLGCGCVVAVIAAC